MYLKYESDRAPEDPKPFRLDLDEKVDHVEERSKGIWKSCDLGGTSRKYVELI